MTVEREPGNGDEAGDVIGCSIRGEKNIEKEIPCQDSNEQRRLPGRRYVIAAADGLGSARLSHVGSSAATQAAVEHVEEVVTGRESLNERMLRSALREAFVRARNRLQEVANSRGVAVPELNTTLLVAVGGPAGVGGAAVGDGGIVWHRGGRTGLLVPREDTEYGNETIPLQSDSWTDSYRFGWMPDADAAAVFSDGLDGVAWDGPASVSDELFDQVFDNVAEFSNLDRLERFLADFLDGETLRKSSKDDKTLAIGALPTAEWSSPETTGSPEGSLARARENSDTGHSKTGTELDPGSQTDSGSGQRTSPRTRERSVGTATVDERRGGNQTRLVAGAGSIVAVVLVVFAAVLLTGGGGGTAGLNLSTAEVQGEEGLVIQGGVGDGGFNDSLNLTVRLGEPGNESFVARHNDTQVTDGQFEFSLEPEQLENTTAELYYGKTTYRVVVETDDGMAGNTTLDRGELELETTDLKRVGGSIKGTIIWTQGDSWAYKYPGIELVSASEGANLESSYVGNGRFSFTLDSGTGAAVSENETTVNVGFRDVSAETNQTGVFAKTNETVAIEPASFRVAIQSARDTVAGENLTVTVDVENVGDVTANRTVELDAGSLGTASKSVTLPDNGSTVLDLSVATEAGDAENYTANVSIASGDNRSVDVTVENDTQGGEPEGQGEQNRPVGGTGQFGAVNPSVASTGRDLFAQGTDRSDQYGLSRGGGAR